jgi:alkanesulfonate monooxygenase SsuD/methylene tetrahydromethanopterin reductase-like flavin-dependent oxidoreductase (luciferase family)
MIGLPDTPLKIGVWLSRARPELFLPLTLEAERLGFESVWLSEHLILPATAADAPDGATEHATISGTTPTFDALSYLSFLAGATTRIRLGTWIYLLGLRHPFVSARAVQTLDVASGGRVELGVGAGWLAGEWAAAGFSFADRGRRLDEAIDVCRRLWPKPVQKPWPRLHIGGESEVALRRAARSGDGWIGAQHTPSSAAAMVSRLTQLRSELRADDAHHRAFEVTVGATLHSADDLREWEAAGVTRVIVAPWARSSHALASLAELAEALGRDAADDGAEQ